MCGITITLGPDQDCPICGAKEVEDNTLPVDQWRWNVRPNRVETNGIWWSECLRCKETDGDGWFAIDEDGNVHIEPSRIAAIEARGIPVRIEG